MVIPVSERLVTLAIYAEVLRRSPEVGVRVDALIRGEADAERAVALSAKGN